MKNAYLIRPFPHRICRIDEFRKQCIAAIGWPGLDDLNGRTREELKTLLSGKPYNLSGLELGNAYATVDIFLNQMSIGDIILVPNGDDIFFAEIMSGYYFDRTVDNDTDGYPHQRRVKWLANTSRNNLSKELRSSLKVHRATAKLTKHANEILALSNGEAFVQPKAIPNVAARIFERDGSADERAAEILSQFGEEYSDALAGALAVHDFFKSAGLSSLAATWNGMTDTVFRAAAYEIAHRQKRIQ